MTEHRNSEQLGREQHVDLTTGDGAKRTLMIAFDGVDHKVLIIDVNGSLQVVQNAVDDTPVTAEDILFVTGDSPFTFDINTSLGRNATQFSVINDGPGNFTVSISNDGSVFGAEHTMKNEEVYAIQNINVDSIRLTWVANSAYRIVAL